MRSSPATPVDVVICGLGLIGGFTCDLVARLLSVRSMTILDFDRYESSNLSQNILAADVGRRKAYVQARRLKKIRPDLIVRPIVDRVENVPLGRLRGRVIASCLDSRASRLDLISAAFKLGTACVDAGVSQDGLLARATTYLPGLEHPCYACNLDPAEAEDLKVRFSCSRRAPVAEPTNAQSSLGALAASLQAIEIGKILGGRFDLISAGREILADALHHTTTISDVRRHPACGFDHRPLSIAALPFGARDLTVAGLVEAARGACGPDLVLSLEVEGHPFIELLACQSCGSTSQVTCLLGRFSRSDLLCKRCAQVMVPHGFSFRERLDLVRAPSSVLSTPLSALGFRDGEVFVVHGPTASRHLELSGGRAAQPSFVPEERNGGVQ